jgi:ribosomal protein S18 acetylase RimI-like enzyme
MAIIRPMHPEDAEEVSAIDAAAFGAWWRQLRGEAAGELPRRTQANVLGRLERDPAGCFVAEEQGRPVGLIFSTTWGSVGWFGTFAVLPTYQGRGIGQQLIAASMGYLQRRGCRLIGLETMPESPNNVGLYMRQGFACRFLTLALVKPLGRPAAETLPVSRWSTAAPATQSRWLAELRQAGDAIYPGLDYTKEVDAPVRCGMGEALVLTVEGKAVGVSSVWLASHRQGMGEDQGSVQALFLHPAHTDAESFRALLAATENVAQAQDKVRLALPVNTVYAWAAEQLLRWDYRIERTMVRMVRQGMDDRVPDGPVVELSRWAG